MAETQSKTAAIAAAAKEKADAKAEQMLLQRDAAEDSMAEVRQAQRYSKRMLLQKQSGNGKAQQSLRRIVAERLSHPLLEQMHSSEFKENPLEEQEQRDYRPPSLAKWMAELNEDAAANSADAASALPASAPAIGGLGEGEQGLSELVALKRHLQGNDTYDEGLAVDEFCRALGEIWTLRSPQELRRLFMQIDADSDGKVTWEELLTFLLQKDSGGGEEDNRFLPSVDAVPCARESAHDAPISHVVMLGDKDKYLTLGRDATVRLWNRGSKGGYLQHTKTVSLPEKGWAHALVYCEAHHRLAFATAHSRLVRFGLLRIASDCFGLLRIASECFVYTTGPTRHPPQGIIGSKHRTEFLTCASTPPSHPAFEFTPVRRQHADTVMLALRVHEQEETEQTFEQVLSELAPSDCF